MCGSKLPVTTGKLIGEFGSPSVAEWACWFPSRSESHQSCWQYGILPHRVTALIRGQRAEQNECPRTQIQEERENPEGTGFLLPVSCHIGHCALPWGVGRGGKTRNKFMHTETRMRVRVGNGRRASLNINAVEFSPLMFINNLWFFFFFFSLDSQFTSFGHFVIEVFVFSY